MALLDFSFGIPRIKHELEEMGHSIAHRGPDATATFLDENIGLVHRLSIIDLSEAGIQPMFSTDRRCAIVFNGEIYNFLLTPVYVTFRI